MRPERVSLVPPLRWLAIFAGALLLGFGCCRFGGLTVWGMFGLGLMIVSAIGVVISGLVLLVHVLHNKLAGE